MRQPPARKLMEDFEELKRIARLFAHSGSSFDTLRLHDAAVQYTSTIRRVCRTKKSGR